ncbi:MAG: type II toxin-antitoxin system HicA family toxin [Patescibacteria group bacterium]
MTKSLVCLIGGLGLIWGTLEFHFLVSPGLSDRGIRQTIEKCALEEYGCLVLWEVQEPILLKSTPVEMDNWSGVRQIDAAAMRQQVRMTYEAGMDLVHLKQDTAGLFCQFFFEDKDAVGFLPGNENFWLPEGTEIDDGDVRLHYHGGKFFRVYAAGLMSSFNIFGLRNMFPFWRVRLIYPLYLASKAVAYALGLGAALVAVTGFRTTRRFIKARSRLRTALLARERSKVPRLEQKILRPAAVWSDQQHQGDVKLGDMPPPAGVVVVLPPQSVEKSTAERAPVLLKQATESGPPEPRRQSEFESIVQTLARSKKKTRSRDVREEIDLMLQELSSGRHGVKGARLFLRRAQVLVATANQVTPAAVRQHPKRSLDGPYCSLPSLTGGEIVRVLGKIGYRLDRFSRSHFFLKCPGRQSVSVPNHADIHSNRFRGILRQTGISPEEFGELYLN